MPVSLIGYVVGLNHLMYPSNIIPNGLRNRDLNPNARSIFIFHACRIRQEGV
jgi:hypothetical protein